MSAKMSCTMRIRVDKAQLSRVMKTNGATVWYFVYVCSMCCFSSERCYVEVPQKYSVNILEAVVEIVTDDKLTKWNVNPVITQSNKNREIKDVLSFDNLLLNWCYLPSLWGHINQIRFHLTFTRIVSTFLWESRIHICLFFHTILNNQFVVSMYNESLSLSNMNISLMFWLASMPLTTQLYIIFYIFSEIYLLKSVTSM